MHILLNYVRQLNVRNIYCLCNIHGIFHLFILSINLINRSKISKFVTIFFTMSFSHLRRESRYVCANIDISLQERRQPYRTLNTLPLQERASPRNSVCSYDYIEPDVTNIEVIGQKILSSCFSCRRILFDVHMYMI